MFGVETGNEQAGATSARAAANLPINRTVCARNDIGPAGYPVTPTVLRGG
jgi:hypothetical protein